MRAAAAARRLTLALRSKAVPAPHRGDTAISINVGAGLFFNLRAALRNRPCGIRRRRPCRLRRALSARMMQAKK
jgi:hypothetical protein